MTRLSTVVALTLACCLSAFGAPPTVAQGPRRGVSLSPAPRGPSRFAPIAWARLELPSDSGAIPRTHWLEGAETFGAVGTLLGVGAGIGICHSGDSQPRSCVPVTVFCALVFGLVGFGGGALIGGQFPKNP